jgi:hypothetical protein
MLDIRLDDKVNIDNYDYVVVRVYKKIIKLKKVNKAWETSCTEYKDIERVDFELQLLSGILTLMRWGEAVPIWKLKIVKGTTIYGKYKNETIRGTIERAGKQRIAVSWAIGNLQWHSSREFEYYVKAGVFTIDNRQLS